MGSAKPISPMIEMIRLSSELVHQSTRLNGEMRRRLLDLNVTIGRSREILASWPAVGTPSLSFCSPLMEERRAAAADPQPAPDVEIKMPVAEAVLIRVVEENYVNQTVRLDGRHFVDCAMDGCVLEYLGGPVILEGTHFTGCRFRFGGEAAMTVSMLECFGLIGEQKVPLAAPGGAKFGGSRPN